MIADWCVHNHFDEKEGIEKPHVHVMLTMREAVEKDATILQKLKSYMGLALQLRINDNFFTMS